MMSRGRQSRGPGVSSLHRQPVNNSSSGAAGFNSSSSPYQAPPKNPASRQGSNSNKPGALNTNVFNIPKYGQGGLGGGIGGGMGSGGSYGSYGLGGLGGGIGSGLGSGGRQGLGGLGSAGSGKGQDL